MSNSLWLHELQNARLPCLPLSPGACSNSCPFSRWCHPTTSSSVTPFSWYPQYQWVVVSWLFVSGGQSIGASASASVLPVLWRSTSSLFPHFSEINLAVEMRHALKLKEWKRKNHLWLKSMAHQRICSLRKGLCTYTHKRNYSSYCGFCPQIHVLKFLPPVSQTI